MRDESGGWWWMWKRWLMDWLAAGWGVEKEKGS